MSQPANDVFSQHLSDDEASFHEDASDNGTASNKPKQQQQQLIPTTTTISNIKLPILKKEEYDIWAMEMEHYLEYIDNDVWKVIQNGNSKKRISTGKDGVIRVLPPVSAAEIHAVEKERKARTILLMAIPKEHLRRFHGMDDAKEIWEAIRTSSEGLEKGYDRFQQLLSQLEAHGAEVSTEDANHKFLRSLPSAWSNLAMTMRTKPDVDTLSIDDLYNNLRVFEQELTSTLKSSASAQNVAFVSHSKSDRKRIFKKRSKKKAKNKQIQAREGKDQVKSKSKSHSLEEITTLGAKSAKPKVVLQKIKKTRAKSANRGIRSGSVLGLLYKCVLYNEPKSSTNKVKSGNTGGYSTYTPSTSPNNILEREVLASFADESMDNKLADRNDCYSMKKFTETGRWNVIPRGQMMERRRSFLSRSGARQVRAESRIVLLPDYG
ncbi:hypothetical protein Tco_0508166 [Tanacetum coccineum]